MSHAFRKAVFFEGGISARLEEIGLLLDAGDGPDDIFVPADAGFSVNTLSATAFDLVCMVLKQICLDRAVRAASPVRV